MTRDLATMSSTVPAPKQALFRVSRLSPWSRGARSAEHLGVRKPRPHWISQQTWSFDRICGRILGVWAFGVLCGCPATHPPSAGCGKDTDCKGDRVCVEGSCLAPEPSPNGEGGSDGGAVDPGKVTAGQGERWFRGGPGHAGATAAEGPTDEPVVAWETKLGSVVFATPSLLEVDGVTMAFVGTHGGRFVGVVVEGERGGEIAVDLALGGRIWGTAAIAQDESGPR